MPRSLQDLPRLQKESAVKREWSMSTLHEHGVFMATRDGRRPGLSALRTQPGRKSHTRTNLSFLTGATNRLPSPNN
jgi:hypothetical protein